MQNELILVWLMMFSAVPATAQVNVNVGYSNVSIGINVLNYPALVAVPGYPVYYAPGLNSNYFFYDGMYWVYYGDSWYASSWYNGPWSVVSADTVPFFVLRVPVRYYRMPPPYFGGWQVDASPHWGEHWGNDWAQRRNGWDRWNRSSTPAPAPLPVYQRKYSGDRYPRMEQQQALQTQNYRHQPRDPAVRQQVQTQRAPSAAVPAQRGAQGVPQGANPGPQGTPRSNPPPQGTATAPRAQPPQKRGTPAEQQSPSQKPGAAPRPQPEAKSKAVEVAPKSTPVKAAPRKEIPPVEQKPQQQKPQPPQPKQDQRQQPEPKAQTQEAAPPGRSGPQNEGRDSGQGQDKGRDKPDDRGQERGK
jgi:hypothetical protein